MKPAFKIVPPPLWLWLAIAFVAVMAFNQPTGDRWRSAVKNGVEDKGK